MLDSPFKAHDEVLVTLKGEEGLRAYFSIVNQTEAIELHEIKPGEYIGKYVVPDNTNFTSEMMEVFLADGARGKVSKYQVPYLVSADSIPPGEPIGLETNVTKNGVKLVWKKPEDQDIKNFLIEKAVSGATEYTKVTDTELTEYIDKAVSFGQNIFYRVSTVDKADNSSKSAEVSRMVVTPGPTEITGELKEDTVFYQYSSPFVISKSLIVPKGIKLAIEPGTVVRFEDGAALLIAGKLEAKGTKEANITFKGNRYNIVVSDAGVGNVVLNNTFFRGGNRLEILNSEADISDSIIEAFEHGLVIDKNSAVKVVNCVFSDNKVGVYGKSGSVDCDNVEFNNNSIGFHLEGDTVGSVGTLKLKQNETDVITGTELIISKIETPKRESFEIIRSLKGNVKVTTITPYMKSFSMLKEDSAGELLNEIGESLMTDNQDESIRLMAILKELYPEKYEKAKAIEGYLLFKHGLQKEGKELIKASDVAYKDMLASALGLSATPEKALKIRLVGIKVPVFGNGDGVAAKAEAKSMKYALKDYIDSLVGDLPRKKQFAVNDELLDKPEMYVKGAYPIGTRKKGNMFEGLYIVFLKSPEILYKLQDIGVMGDKKRATRVGVVSCGSTSNISIELSKELSELFFPVVELPAKGCLYEDYVDDIALTNIDTLVVIKETGDTSKSHVGGNMKTINADLGINIYDVSTGMSVLNKNEGSTVFHINKSLGMRKAVSMAFSLMKQDIVKQIVEIDRNVAKTKVVDFTDPEVNVKAAEEAKSDGKEEKPEPVAPQLDSIVTVSVVGVEQIYANHIEEYGEEPFMTFVVENTGTENIKNSELTLELPGYIVKPVVIKLESIPAMDRIRIPVNAEFVTDIKLNDEDKKVEALITLKDDKEEVDFRYPIVIYGSHKTNWGDPDAVAAFIDKQDKSVSSIAVGASVVAGELTEEYQKSKLLKALIAYEYLGKIGVANVSGEVPFTEIYTQKGKADTVNYPSETIEAKAGDVDDIFVLYASILSAMGFDTALVVNKDSVVVLADTDIPVELAEKVGLTRERIVVVDDNIWLPLDPAKVADGVNAAWESGVKSVANLDTDKIVKMSDAIGRIKPAGLFRKELEIKPVGEFKADYQKLIAQ